MPVRSTSSLIIACAIAIWIGLPHSAWAFVVGYPSYQQTWFQNGWLDRRDIAFSMVAGAEGNVYVGGRTEDVYGTSTGDPFGAVVAKYDSSGNALWLKMPFDTNGSDVLGSMAIDSHGDVFAAGFTSRYGLSTEALLLKCDSDGNKLWDRHLGSPDLEAGYDMVLDLEGNAYVVGTTTGFLGSGTNGQGYDAFLAKYAPNGDLVWVRQFEDSIGDAGNTVTIDAAANILVGGSAWQNEAFLLKLGPMGEVIWKQNPNYSSQLNRITQITESTSDPFGNAYVAGFTDGLYDDHAMELVEKDAMVAKYDSDGNLLWQQRLHTAAVEEIGSIVLDNQGNVFVGGKTKGDLGGVNSGDYDAFWAKYDSSGNLLWLEQFGTPFEDVLHGLAVDPSGRVFVTGTMMWEINDYYLGESDVFLACYVPVPEPGALGLLITAGVAAVLLSRRRRNR